jgi:uncharacterized membrane protein
MTAKYGLDLGLEGQEKRNVCLAGEIKDLAQDERLMKATDQQFEIFLGKLLRTGVVIAALIVLAGGVWFLSEAHGARREYATFRGVPAELSSLDGIFHGAVGGQALAVIQLGILVLIATPVARVLFSMLGFALEKDWMYVGVTAMVLALLLYSLFNHSMR